MDPLPRTLILEVCLAWLTVLVYAGFVVSGCFKVSKSGSNKGTRSSDQTDQQKNLITPTQDPAIPVKSPIQSPKPVSTPSNVIRPQAVAPAVPPPPPPTAVTPRNAMKRSQPKKSAKKPKRALSRANKSEKSNSKRFPDSEAGKGSDDVESEKPKKRTSSLDSQDGCDNNVMIVSSKEEIQQPPQSH